MKLIADSGSTKTHWHYAGRNFFTDGINPFFFEKNEIKTFITNELSEKIAFDNISEIYFYGAGCNPEKSNMLENTFTDIFHNAKIEVKSDLLGAARALLQHSAGIVCILGTGSNSCFYNGEEIISNIPPLGYILGDEGSGAVLGKSLINNILKKMLSENIINKFKEKYSISAAEIIENVYRRPFPNRYLAHFSEFLLENSNEPEIDALILNEFQAFFDRNIAKYDFHNYSVNFVGSIAFYFSNQIRQVADYNEFKIDKISQSPMEGLIAFHS